MKEVIENMIATIVKADDEDTSTFVLEEMAINLKELLSVFEMTINCPSNWRSLRDDLLDEYADDQFIVDIISEF